MGADAKRRGMRKRKFGTIATNYSTTTTPIGDEVEDALDGSPKKKRQSSLVATKSGNHEVEIYGEGASLVATEEAGQDRGKVNPKAQRFIVFIGNLPYTATDQSISRHFVKVQPKFTRHRTEKGSGKSKGFAFLEFEGYDRMKTCLKLYHGSSFDDGISPARKINVELTAGGGGGKSKDRIGKLRAKNERLYEQRLRRAKEEAKHNAKTKDKKLQPRGKGQANDQGNQAAGINRGPTQQTSIDNGDIHPSRRGRIAVPIRINNT